MTSEKKSEEIEKSPEIPKFKQIRLTLTAPLVQGVIASAIPNGINLDAKRLAWTAVTMMETPNDKGECPLLECSITSISRAVVQCAELGLEFGTHLGHCYMIPRKGEACFQMGYRGYMALAYRSGVIKRIWSDVIYEADNYRIVRGEAPELKHDTTESEFLRGRDVPIGEGKPHVKVEDGGAGMPLGAYACAELKSGGVLWDVVSEEICARARESSKAQNSPAYRNWPDEMRKRTAITRARKAWPIDPLMATAQQMDDTGDGGSQDLAREIVKAVVETTGEQALPQGVKPKLLDGLVQRQEDGEGSL